MYKATFAQCSVPEPVVLKSCQHQGVVYNCDADDQDLGTNDEDETFSCDEFQNFTSAPVIKCDYSCRGIYMYSRVIRFTCKCKF